MSVSVSNTIYLLCLMFEAVTLLESTFITILLPHQYLVYVPVRR